MNKNAGIKPAELQSLPVIRDRMTFLYVQRCQINRHDGAITVTDDKGIVHIPAATLSVLLLGPGTTVTHRAMELIGNCGVCVIWMGEGGINYYAGGKSLTHRSKLQIKQASLVSNQRTRLMIVKKMYSMRFSDEDIEDLTMQQLRGREGSRMRSIYKREAKKWNIPWNGRNYDHEKFEESDNVNKALSVGNACLYGLAHAVIFALGCSTALGFMHVGHDNSFVYDIADLYKTEIVIPLAFEVAMENHEDIPSFMRRAMREKMVSTHLLERMVKDLLWLFEDDGEEENISVEMLYLWDDKLGNISSGIQYSQWEDDV